MTYIIFKLSDTCVIANTCRRLPSFQPWSLVTIFKCEKNNEVDKTAQEDSAGDVVETYHALSQKGCPCLTGSVQVSPRRGCVCACLGLCVCVAQSTPGGQGFTASQEMTENMHIKT